MKRVILLAVAFVFSTAVVASAQNTVRRSSARMDGAEPRVELIPLGGYAWTMSMDVYGGPTLGYGEIDFSDTGYYGGALDFKVSPPGSYKVVQARLMYRRSDGNIQLRGFGNIADIDAAIEYWQIGAVSGLMRGNALPFASVTLGGTRLVAGGEDQWKFSMIFGLGVKVYGQGKLGFMLNGNFPITFTDSWGGVTVGTGGLGVGIGGTGISQLDVGGGLIIRL